MLAHDLHIDLELWTRPQDVATSSRDSPPVIPFG
jgi:hypothetical protein